MTVRSSWKKKARKVLLNHPRMTVVEDIVLLPSGHETEYLLITPSPDSVCLVAKRSDGKFLVQKEYSYPSNEWLYQFPGGGVSQDEPLENAAARELAEEASLQGELHALGWFYPDNRRRTSKMQLFLVTDLKEDTSTTKDVEEEFETYWFTESEIDQLIQRGEVVNYSMLAAWAFYKTKGILKV